MSWKVVEEVVEHSQTKGTARNVLLAIAETAHHDGVAFGLPHAPSRGREGRGESLQERANAGVRSIERAISIARARDELEVRTYRIGSRNLKAYRVTVGRLRDIEADHHRLADRYNVLLDRPFSTPAELLMPPESRPANLAGRNQAADPPEIASQPAKLAESDPHKLAGLTRARNSENSSFETVLNSSGTSSSEKTEEEVAAAAAAVDESSTTDLLLAAFAEEIGAWPETRSDWAGWKGQFKKLADQGVSVEQLRYACRSYREYFRAFKWKRDHQGLDEAELAALPPAELTPFALTKHWLTITASFERSYFKLHRWVTQVSWRIDADEVAWILENARTYTDGERRALQTLANEVRRSHERDEDTFLRWVETEGFALDVEAWVRQLKTWPVSKEAREAGGDRRAELRAELAGIHLALDDRAVA